MIKAACNQDLVNIITGILCLPAKSGANNLILLCFKLIQGDTHLIHIQDFDPSLAFCVGVCAQGGIEKITKPAVIFYLLHSMV